MLLYKCPHDLVMRFCEALQGARVRSSWRVRSSNLSSPSGLRGKRTCRVARYSLAVYFACAMFGQMFNPGQGPRGFDEQFRVYPVSSSVNGHRDSFFVSHHTQLLTTSPILGLILRQGAS